MTTQASADVKLDGQSRVARTGLQTGGAAAVVVLVEWVAQTVGWSGSLPTPVSGAMVTLLGIAASAWMNRRRLRGELTAS